MRLLWLLGKGSARYGALRRGVACGDLGVEPTPRILSRELKDLQRRGPIDRHQEEVVPPRVHYAITDLGRTVLPIIDAVIAWGHTGAHEHIIAHSSARAEE